MGFIKVDESILRSLLHTLQTSYLILDRLEAEGVDNWEGYSRAMVQANEDLDNDLEAYVENMVGSLGKGYFEEPVKADPSMDEEVKRL